jgi:hypothetical protein
MQLHFAYAYADFANLMKPSNFLCTCTCPWEFNTIWLIFLQNIWKPYIEHGSKNILKLLIIDSYKTIYFIPNIRYHVSLLFFNFYEVGPTNYAVSKWMNQTDTGLIKISK